MKACCDEGTQVNDLGPSWPSCFGSAIDSEHNKNSVYVLYRYTRVARAKHGKQAYARLLSPCVIYDTYFLPIHKL